MPELMSSSYYRERAAKLFDLASKGSDPEIVAINLRAAQSYTELAELTFRQASAKLDGPG